MRGATNAPNAQTWQASMRDGTPAGSGAEGWEPKVGGRCVEGGRAQVNSIQSFEKECVEDLRVFSRIFGKLNRAHTDAEPEFHAWKRGFRKGKDILGIEPRPVNRDATAGASPGWLMDNLMNGGSEASPAVPEPREKRRENTWLLWRAWSQFCGDDADGMTGNKCGVPTWICDQVDVRVPFFAAQLISNRIDATQQGAPRSDEYGLGASGVRGVGKNRSSHSQRYKPKGGVEGRTASDPREDWDGVPTSPRTASATRAGIMTAMKVKQGETYTSSDHRTYIREETSTTEDLMVCYRQEHQQENEVLRVNKQAEFLDQQATYDLRRCDNLKNHRRKKTEPVPRASPLSSRTDDESASSSNLKYTDRRPSKLEGTDVGGALHHRRLRLSSSWVKLQ
ncbi:hypothetical protein C8R47DRAFT_1203064 [Mycena vitilis]|nr:hypothetical protein C8R47DRAFT_1203064 [Mycena vitilis]